VTHDLRVERVYDAAPVRVRDHRAPWLLVFRSTMSMPDGSSLATRTHVTFTETAAGRPG
jgi:hypothetical protein